MSVYYCSLMLYKLPALDSFFFFNDTATTEIYTLSLHDALPIFDRQGEILHHTRTAMNPAGSAAEGLAAVTLDRKSTRLNSSHLVISYAVFCLKKKKKHYHIAQHAQVIACASTQ